VLDNNRVTLDFLPTWLSPTTVLTGASKLRPHADMENLSLQGDFVPFELYEALNLPFSGAQRTPDESHEVGF
jgi:hypothetical protein